MNQLCLLTNLNSSDIAAWAQAIVSSIAIIAGASVVFWQTRLARLDLNGANVDRIDGGTVLQNGSIIWDEATEWSLCR